MTVAPAAHGSSVVTRAGTRQRGKGYVTLEIVEASRAILEEIQPASIRAVCYRLFTMGVIDSMSKGNTNKVSRALVWAREEMRVPWEWIVDETREVEQVPSWSDPDSLMRAAAGQYRKNYWTQQPNRIEVWSEKGTVRGTLKPVLDEFGLPFRVMHGYGSATAIKDIANTSMIDRGKPFIGLYVGDWDPSGLHMSELDLPDRIGDYGGDVQVIRVALNEDDVKFSRLPSFQAATKRGDPRYRWFVENYGNTCWELDALSPVILRDRVTDAITRLLDIDAWNRMIEVENVELESMTDVLGQWSKLMQARNCSGKAR
jgi:hypothetical protein